MRQFIANYSHSFFVSPLTVHWKKMIFNGTMRKFLNESGDLQLPKGPMQLIMMYTVKPVETIELNMLKRWVHLMDEEYSRWIRSNALAVVGCFCDTCPKQTIAVRGFIKFGLMEKLRMFPLLLQTGGIKDEYDYDLYNLMAKLMTLLSRDSFGRKLLTRGGLIEKMKEMAMKNSSHMMTARRGLWFLSDVVMEEDMLFYCYDQGIMIPLFDLLLIVIAGTKLCDKMSRHSRAAVQRILQFDEANGLKMRQLFTERLETYDRSKIKPENSEFFEELVSTIKE